ncbi:hypothetical protein HYW94_04350 [Candidatus Uhrbacteria bacterium]|nr:hypothetical protein [Candidatus Uhrbacteria bacterium]
MARSLKKAWVIAVDMGYGHQRAAYPLKDIAYKGIITMNTYEGVPAEEKKVWKQSREGYELISRIQAKSSIGRILFDLFDKIQEIPSFYPRRDMSRANLQLMHTYHMIEKGGVGKHLFTKVLTQNPKIPLLATFFLAAFAAEFYGYEGEIYCQVCDTDLSRTWVPRDPKRSRIKYLAPNPRVVERLKLYGVKPENIFLVGFPLPKENIGGPGMCILRKDIGARLVNLDPQNHMLHKFGHIIQYHLGKKYVPKRSTHPLTITFAVGGAGAQSDLGVNIMKSLRQRILDHGIRLNVVAGVREEVYKQYKNVIKELRLEREYGKHVCILYEKTKTEYFVTFNEMLRTTDILWTKPSELSFYTALGLPIIMAPSVGSQEDFNRIWLKTIGGGISQDDPRYTDEWLFDWIKNGWLARAALNGFSNAEIMGTYEIENLLFHKGYELKDFEGKPVVTI